MYLKNTKLFRLVLAAITISLLLPIAPSLAERSIVAVVNSIPISSYDVNARLDLLFSGGKKPSEQVMQNLKKEMLKTLIRDKIRLDYSKKNSFAPSETEITQALDNFLKSRGADKNTIRQQNLSLAAIRDEIEAKIAWKRVIEAQFTGSLVVSDEQIDKQYLSRIKELESWQYRYLEIVLPYGEKVGRSKEATQGLALEVLRRSSQDGKFSDYARQVSASASAANGGLVNWTGEKNIQSEVANVLNQLEKGQLSNPIILSNAIVVVGLLDKQAPLTPEDIKLKTQYMIQHIEVKFASQNNRGNNEKSKAARSKAIVLANKLYRSFVSCTDASQRMATINGVTVRTAPPISGEMIDVSYRDKIINSKLQDKLPIKINKDSIGFIALCARSKPDDLRFTTREEIRGELANQLIVDRARQLLARLEKEANIQMVN